MTPTMKIAAVPVFLIVPCWLIVLIAGRAPWDVWAIAAAFMVGFVALGVAIWRSV